MLDDIRFGGLGRRICCNMILGRMVCFESMSRFAMFSLLAVMMRIVSMLMLMMKMKMLSIIMTFTPLILKP